jgi:hypothetical protein
VFLAVVKPEYLTTKERKDRKKVRRDSEPR